MMILGKIITLFSSIMGRPDLQPQHMKIRTRKLVLSLTEESGILVLSKTSS